MKLIFLILFFAFIPKIHAQDYCKQINKVISDDKTVFDYASPFDPQEAPPIRVTRNYSNNGEFSYDNFIVIFQIPCDLDDVYIKNADGTRAEKEEHKLAIQFEDKSMITTDTIKITHDFTEDRSQSLRVLYYPLNSRTLPDFMTKKIIGFSLAGHERAVPPETGNAVMHYVICMKAVK